MFWHPKGALVREQMENFLKEQWRARGYSVVYTPHVAKVRNALTVLLRGLGP